MSVMYLKKHHSSGYFALCSLPSDLIWGRKTRAKCMRSGNPDCFHTVSPHSSKQMKGKRTPEPRWVQTLRPTSKFTLQSSYSKWHLTHLLAIYLEQRSHLLTLSRRRRCQMAPGGKHVPKDTFLFTPHVQSHI